MLLPNFALRNYHVFKPTTTWEQLLLVSNVELKIENVARNSQYLLCSCLGISLIISSTLDLSRVYLNLGVSAPGEERNKGDKLFMFFCVCFFSLVFFTPRLSKLLTKLGMILPIYIYNREIC